MDRYLSECMERTEMTRRVYEVVKGTHTTIETVRHRDFVKATAEQMRVENALREEEPWQTE